MDRLPRALVRGRSASLAIGGRIRCSALQSSGSPFVEAMSIYKFSPSCGGIFLMGVGVNETGSAAFPELSQAHEMRWETMFSGKKDTNGITLGLGKEWQVAIVPWSGSRVSVYTTGQRFENSASTSATGRNSQEIGHFRIEGDRDCADDTRSERRVTAKKVFLYNRPLSMEEFRKHIAPWRSRPLQRCASI
ncbi:trans-sialidase [Trypanosoma cruzi]|nr:trans-sialidase [Trypanosoma cruzi]